MPTILVDNLPADARAESLEQIFSRFGTVTESKVVRDQSSRRAKTQGYVEMPRKEEATRAVRRLNRQIFRGFFLNDRPAS